MFFGHGDTHASSHGAEADVHVDYGVQGGGHGKVSASEGATTSFHFPLFSPLALATLFSAVGAYGLIAIHGFGAGEGRSLAVAVPAAFATAYLVTYIGWRLVSTSRGSSAIRLADLAGAQAEVITPIPAGGIGEVAALVDGQRYAGPAREENGQEVPRGARVTVKGLVGTTLVISKGGS